MWTVLSIFPGASANESVLCIPSTAAAADAIMAYSSLLLLLSLLL
jgi:hypothetical protein